MNTIQGTAFKRGVVALLARVVDASGKVVGREDVLAIQCYVYLLEGTSQVHTETLALSVDKAILDTPTVDPMWRIDTIGYNFRHDLDTVTSPVFALSDRCYLLEYRLFAADGHDIYVRFRVNII
jgi:hypothetical protein